MIRTRWPPATSISIVPPRAPVSLDEAASSRTDLDRQEEVLRRQGGIRVRRKPRVAQPFEDDVRIQPTPPRHMCDGNARRGRLKAERPLLLDGPEPLGSTRHRKVHSVRYPKRKNIRRSPEPAGQRSGRLNRAHHDQRAKALTPDGLRLHDARDNLPDQASTRSRRKSDIGDFPDTSRRSRARVPAT
jgi:hypothetical protein